jgi:hypothetical protein
LLWRGTRDGFGAADFHRRCDGHPNTLTLIADTGGNIFGGFTPVEWESRPRTFTKADPSMRSFVFTLKNPHDVPPRRFALKLAEISNAINCVVTYGPIFFGGIVVADKSNANSSSYTSCFGLCYTNDTDVPSETFFTNSPRFTVDEIEVFEIRD